MPPSARSSRLPTRGLLSLPHILSMAMSWRSPTLPNIWVFILTPNCPSTLTLTPSAKKAKCTKAFFSRNLSHTSQKVKEAVYTTFIRPTVEFAASSWDPHTQRNTKKIEQVQRTSARFVMGDHRRTSSVTAMLNHLDWPSLEERLL